MGEKFAANTSRSGIGPQLVLTFNSGAEDFVPVLTKDTNGIWKLHDIPSKDGKYLIRRYRPGPEGEIQVVPAYEIRTA